METKILELFCVLIASMLALAEGATLSWYFADNMPLAFVAFILPIAVVMIAVEVIELITTTGVRS